MEQMPGKLLKVKDGPNRILQTLRALYGREDGNAKYDGLSSDEKQCPHVQALAKREGYVGLQLEGAEAEPKNTVVFDLARANADAGPVNSGRRTGEASRRVA
jgi:hypothetical protein